MANTFEVITKFQPATLDAIFLSESKTAILENGSKFIDLNFAETGYVKVAEMLVDGLGNYREVNELPVGGAEYAHYAGQNSSGGRDGMPIGNASLKWKIYELQWKRAKEFIVDYITDEKTAGTVIANLLNEFNRTKVVPEVDAVRFAEMAKKASVTLGNLVVESGAIAANTIIHKFNAAFEWQTEHGVPEEDQVIFVNPAVMTLIRETDEIKHFLTQADFKNGNGVTFQIQAYMGRPIIEVSSDRFFTDVVLTQNGYTAASTSKVINFMIVSKKAVLPIRKLEYSKVFKPGEVHGFYGYVIDYLMYHGLIVPKNKILGVYVDVGTTAASTVSGKLDVLLTSGASVSDSFKMEEFYTVPAGLNGRVAYQSSSSEITSGLKAVGDSITVDGSTFKYLSEGVEVVESNDHIQCVLVGSEGKALAVTGDLDISSVKHA